MIQYPKVKDAGGFELLRSLEGGSRELEVIRMPIGGYTTECLKAVINNAKLYIRQLQTDLNVDQTSESSSSACDVSRIYMSTAHV